jgi:hypothetical protein
VLACAAVWSPFRHVVEPDDDLRCAYVEGATWKPWIGYVFGQPDRIYFPTNRARSGEPEPADQPLAQRRDLARLRNLVRDAEAQDKPLHVVGSGWSFTGAPFTSGYLVATAPRQGLRARRAGHALDDLLPIDQLHVSEDVRHGAVFAHGGCTLETVMDHILPTGRVVISPYASCRQTLAGLISTGTHGAVMREPPPADAVLGLWVIAEGGKLFWLQRPGGPVAAGDVPFDGFDGEVIADDAVMDAAILSLGCAGIIYAVLLRVRPLYHLASSCFERVVARGDYSYFAPGDELAALIADPEVQSLEILINAHTSRVLDGKPAHTVHVTVGRLCPPGGTKWVDMTVGQAAMFAWYVSKDVVEGRLAPFQLVDGMPRQVDAILAKTRPLTPDGPRIGTPHAFIARGAPPIRASVGEHTFRRDQAPAVVAAIVEWVEAQSAAERPFVLPGAICLRYAKPSRALLSPLGIVRGEVHDMSCEVFALQAVYGLDETRDRLLEAMRVLQDLGGAPHWGKLHAPDAEQTVERFGTARIAAWRAAMRRLNPTKRTFENDFARVAGLVE